MKSRKHAELWLLPTLCAILAACDGSAWLPNSNAANNDSKLAPAVVRNSSIISVPEMSPLRKSLQIAVVETQVVQRPIIVPAVIEADPTKLVKIVPPLAGRIVKLHKMLGDPVHAGDPLFTLDSADLASAQSEAVKTQAALNLARKNLERQQELAHAEIIAQKDLQQAENDFTQAESESQRTQARLAQLGVALSASSGREYVLRSPLNGHVIDMTGAQGGYWNDTNAPIMTVADLSTVWLAASVQEKDLASVFVGQLVKMTLNAYDGESFEGKVRYVGAMVDMDTRTVKVRVAINNTSGRFRPGMFAKAVFSGQAHQAVVVPATALVQSGFNVRVFVEKSAGVFETRIVKPGAQIGDRFEILSGLKTGERIVAKEGILLND